MSNIVNLKEPEDLLTNESFLSYLYQTDPAAVEQWTQALEQHPKLKVLADAAVLLLKDISLPEQVVPAAQIDAAEAILMKRIDQVASMTYLVPFYRRPWVIVAVSVTILLVVIFLLKFTFA